jgi:hypothetical protein
MRFKEYLIEMPIKLVDIQTKGRKISIQIRTNNMFIDGIQPGQGEHFPAHIHVVNFSAKLNVPIEIKTGRIMSDKHNVEGKLTKQEESEIKWFFDYYGRDELIEIFNKGMRGSDPSTLFNELHRRKQIEHKNNGN